MDPTGLILTPWNMLVALVLAVARPIGFLAINPLWSRLNLTGLLRGAAATAIAIPAIPHVFAHLGAAPLSGVATLLLTVKEGLLGAILGFMLGVPIWSAQFAGDVLDQQRGATAGRLSDPGSSEDVSISGTLLVLAATALFVMNGGLLVLAGLLYASWSVWPLFSAMPAPTDQAPILVLRLLQDVTAQGVLLAVPLVIAMLLSDTAVSLVARFAPQLRVEDVSAAARNLVFCVALLLYVGFLLQYFSQTMLFTPELLTGMQKGLR